MVTINNEDLRDIFNYLATIENILTKEVRQINGNKYYLDKIVPENIIKVYSQKEKTAITFADNLSKTAYESSIVTIVATFERVVFAKYKTAYGTIKNVVRNHSTKPLDYFNSRENFVNGNIDKLSGIISLIEGHLSNDILEKLKIIKDHRNYIAHGKRDIAPPSVEFRLDEVAKILDDVIKEIEY
ncbi:MAG: hypothetical protein HXX16_10640 [Bacteroidales bacterium]|nr:hypothetical protein [Bacteroidales bacterium]